jgi:hypothetical protein
MITPRLLSSTWGPFEGSAFGIAYVSFVVNCYLFSFTSPHGVIKSSTTRRRGGEGGEQMKLVLVNWSVFHDSLLFFRDVEPL